MGVLYKFCVVSGSRRAAKFLPTFLSVVVEIEFYSERSVPLGMASPQHRKARRGRPIAGNARVATVARSHRCFDFGHVVRVASRPNGIGCLGYSAGPADVRRYSLRIAFVPPVCSARFGRYSVLYGKTQPKARQTCSGRI